MTQDIECHYSGSGSVVAAIAAALRAAGKDLDHLSPEDLASVDEFHVRGRKATLELAQRMNLRRSSRVLDIGSGLGGPARTLAQVYGCEVVGIDLTEAFCEAAMEMSRWVGLAGKVRFVPGDAANLPFDDQSFDAAMTIHVAMNIPAKDAVYDHAHRILRKGSIFAVYDILQGEGGDVIFPVPWARDPSISHLATLAEMRSLLAGAGFTILDEIDSSEEGLTWFRAMSARLNQSDAPPVTFQTFLGGDYPTMVRNQVTNLAEGRIRTVTFICRA